MQTHTHSSEHKKSDLKKLLSQRSQSNAIKLNVDELGYSFSRPCAYDEKKYHETIQPIAREHRFFKALSQVMARQGHPLSLPRAVAALEKMMGPLGDPLKSAEGSALGSFSLPLKTTIRRQKQYLPVSYLLILRDWDGHLVFDLHRLTNSEASDPTLKLNKEEQVRLFQSLHAYIEGSARCLRPLLLPDFRRIDHASGVMYGLEGGAFFFQGKGD